MAQELQLSNLVAQAHKLRAVTRAKRYAARFDRPMYVFATRHGLTVDSAAPTIGGFWIVAPTGEVMPAAHGSYDKNALAMAGAKP